ncbi:MAG: myxococcus cysteine-rich repeat containing protein [Candidatus Pacearchaeota archaeon]
MKKLLVFLVMMFGLMGIVMASSETQTTSGDVQTAVDANVSDTLPFGSVVAGQDSNPQDSVITIGANNNVNLQVAMELTINTGLLFQNIFMDLDKSGTYEDTEQLDQILYYSITDIIGQHDFPITTILRVPTGFNPGAKTGVITYTITEYIPAPVCGNGAVESGETCDDGNTANSDGCSSTCIIEPSE